METTPLRELVSAPGPFASVYFDASHDTEDAVHQIDLRWRALRAELDAQEADDQTLRALEEAVRTGPPAVGRAGRALIAADGQILLDQQLPVAPPGPTARFSPLPYLLPLAELTQPPIPHVVVRVDRIGAELHGVDGHGDSVDTTVEGQEHPVHKIGDAGWAHRKVQQYVENVVQRNVNEVAEETARLVRRLRARLLVLAGEVQARSALRESVPPDCQQVAVEVDTGSRAGGTDPQVLDQEVLRLVNERRRADHQAVVERFHAEIGSQRGRATHGLREVATALREARVDVLLITASLIGNHMLWTSSEPTQVAVDEAELRTMGAPRLTRRPADEVLPCAAVATEAEVLVVGEELGLLEGVGALLRYP